MWLWCGIWRFFQENTKNGLHNSHKSPTFATLSTESRVKAFQSWKCEPTYWRGGRVAETTSLLNWRRSNPTTSSNLVLSAKELQVIDLQLFLALREDEMRTHTVRNRLGALLCKEPRSLRQTTKQNRSKLLTCYGFSFIYIQKHIQIAELSILYTNASV